MFNPDSDTIAKPLHVSPFMVCYAILCLLGMAQRCYVRLNGMDCFVYSDHFTVYTTILLNLGKMSDKDSLLARKNLMA